MPYLTRNQRTRAYGSYNSKKNSFMLSTINNGSCWIPRQARCQAPCGITFPKWKSSEYPLGIPWDEELYKSLVQGRQNAIKNTDNKRISGTVRVSSSEYQMNKASGLSTQNIIFNYHQPKPGYERNDLELLQWNQSSDRAFPSRFNKMMKVNVPSHGNSTKTSLTRHRPGAGAGGKQNGVDLKHNSYHRYLLKKKGLKPLRGVSKSTVPSLSGTDKEIFDKSVQNNKWRKDSIVANMNECGSPDCKPLPYIPTPKKEENQVSTNPSLPTTVSVNPNKELPEEIKPEKSPADFFNIKNDFDYSIKPNNNVERIIENYSELDIQLTDLNNIEDIYSDNAYISYLDIHGKEMKINLQDIDSGIVIKVQNPVSFKFRTDQASFDAIYKNNKWICNPPISKQDKEMFTFDMLQNLTLVARVNNK